MEIPNSIMNFDKYWKFTEQNKNKQKILIYEFILKMIYLLFFIFSYNLQNTYKLNLIFTKFYI